MPPDNFLGDSEAEFRARNWLLSRRINTKEGLEDLVDDRGGNAGPSILDYDDRSLRLSRLRSLCRGSRRW